MTTTISPRLNAQQCSDMLAQYVTNRQTVLGWAHASWLDALPLPRSVVNSAQSDQKQDCARSLLDALGVSLLPYTRILHAAVAPLVASPMDDAMRILRLRALTFRRPEIKHWIDKARRARLCDWVGAAYLQWLPMALRLPDAAGANRLRRRQGMPPLESVSAEHLAWEGFCLFERDLQFAGNVEPSALTLLRLGLPREACALPWIDAMPAQGQSNDGATLLAWLGQRFLESS